MLADFDRAYGLRSVSLRYFNAAGADTDQHDLGQAPGASHIIARLLEAYKDNKAFTLNGRGYDTPDGTCIRDYVHVQDIATAHLLATRYLLAGGASTQLNLGAGTGTSNGDIIQAVHRLVGPVEIAEGPRRPGDPDRLIADATRASTVLGWQPQHSDIDTIISSACAWYNKQP
jgi:UDP-glucose 4-epimerase